MLKIVKEQGRDDLAKVYVGLMRDYSEKYLVEFVESLQPPIPRDEKWVIIVSSQFGCPVRCLMCDAGKEFVGNLTADEIIEEIDYLVRKYFPDGRVPVTKFKIQFARMGEPALNPAVLSVIEKLPLLYDAPGLIPCIATIAPKGSEDFFDRLLYIKARLYQGGKFQLQFSINTTDPEKREKLMPFPKWDFEKIAKYGDKFYQKGDRKITLNFAITEDYPVDDNIVKKYFSPEKFLIKLTPVNPTSQVEANNLKTYIDPADAVKNSLIVNKFRQQGYDTILSIGELEENQIGSNCGEFVSTYRQESKRI